MNLQELLNGVIAEAIADDRELIPTDKLPSALIIAARIEELESALQDILGAHANDNIRPKAFYIASKALAQS